MKKPKLWIQDAKEKMEKKGTVGKFSKAAKKEGESTLEHAEEVKNKKGSSLKEKREAQFAINMHKFSKSKHKKK
jgi:hypothetical protein